MLMLVAGVAGVLGLVFLTNAVHFFRKERRERAAWASSVGMVVEQRERITLEGGTVFTPIVKFTTEKGAVVQFEDAQGRRPARHRVGESVYVLYDRAAPESARIDTGTRWALVAPFLIAALIGLLVAAGLAWFG